MKAERSSRQDPKSRIVSPTVMWMLDTLDGFPIGSRDPLEIFSDMDGSLKHITHQLVSSRRRSIQKLVDKTVSPFDRAPPPPPPLSKLLWSDQQGDAQEALGPLFPQGQERSRSIRSFFDALNHPMSDDDGCSSLEHNDKSNLPFLEPVWSRAVQESEEDEEEKLVVVDGDGDHGLSPNDDSHEDNDAPSKRTQYRRKSRFSVADKRLRQSKTTDIDTNTQQEKTGDDTQEPLERAPNLLKQNSTSDDNIPDKDGETPSPVENEQEYSTEISSTEAPSYVSDDVPNTAVKEDEGLDALERSEPSSVPSEAMKDEIPPSSFSTSLLSPASPTTNESLPTSWWTSRDELLGEELDIWGVGLLAGVTLLFLSLAVFGRRSKTVPLSSLEDLEDAATLRSLPAEKTDDDSQAKAETQVDESQIHPKAMGRDESENDKEQGANDETMNAPTEVVTTAPDEQKFLLHVASPDILNLPSNETLPEWEPYTADPWPASDDEGDIAKGRGDKSTKNVTVHLHFLLVSYLNRLIREGRLKRRMINVMVDSRSASTTAQLVALEFKLMTELTSELQRMGFGTKAGMIYASPIHTLCMPPPSLDDGDDDMSLIATSPHVMGKLRHSKMRGSLVSLSSADTDEMSLSSTYTYPRNLSISSAGNVWDGSPAVVTIFEDPNVLKEKEKSNDRDTNCETPKRSNVLVDEKINRSKEDEAACTTPKRRNVLIDIKRPDPPAAQKSPEHEVSVSEYEASEHEIIFAPSKKLSSDSLKSLDIVFTPSERPPSRTLQRTESLDSQAGGSRQVLKVKQESMEIDQQSFLYGEEWISNANLTMPYRAGEDETDDPALVMGRRVSPTQLDEIFIGDRTQQEPGDAQSRLESSNKVVDAWLHPHGQGSDET